MDTKHEHRSIRAAARISDLITTGIATRDDIIGIINDEFAPVLTAAETLRQAVLNFLDSAGKLPVDKCVPLANAVVAYSLEDDGDINDNKIRKT